MILYLYLHHTATSRNMISEPDTVVSAVLAVLEKPQSLVYLPAMKGLLALAEMRMS